MILAIFKSIFNGIKYSSPVDLFHPHLQLGTCQTANLCLPPHSPLQLSIRLSRGTVWHLVLVWLVYFTDHSYSSVFIPVLV